MFFVQINPIQKIPIFRTKIWGIWNLEENFRRLFTEGAINGGFLFFRCGSFFWQERLDKAVNPVMIVYPCYGLAISRKFPQAFEVACMRFWVSQKNSKSWILDPFVFSQGSMGKNRSCALLILMEQNCQRFSFTGALPWETHVSISHEVGTWWWKCY